MFIYFFLYKKLKITSINVILYSFQFTSLYSKSPHLKINNVDWKKSSSALFVMDFDFIFYIIEQKNEWRHYIIFLCK